MTKYLKLLFVALFATMTVSLYSCKDDKDEPEGGDIVGTWKSALSGVFGETQYIQFQKDGTAINVIIDDGDGKMEIEKGKWSMSGNVLSLNGFNSTIESLTSSKLVVITLGIPTTWLKVPDSEIEKYLK